jgi:hypothetical protein
MASLAACGGKEGAEQALEFAAGTAPLREVCINRAARETGAERGTIEAHYERRDVFGNVRYRVEAAGQSYRCAVTDSLVVTLFEEA